ncbi:ABC transporter ATP-binding protein [Patescibacteria group bacterium]|nr:ABC transporter ATP-binding protein [Patescibacteria group bacterium]
MVVNQLVVQTNNLCRDFGRVQAVNDISFEVSKGEICGILGCNGAGKTTLLRILTGTLRPTSGNVKILDYSLPQQAEKVKKYLGYLPQKAALYQNLTASQNFAFYCTLFGLTRASSIREVQERLFSVYDLRRFRNVLTKKLSGGYQQRLALVCALAHQPKILFLDEPTVGLDPVFRRELWDHLYQLSREEEITLVITTHYMEEAERCDKVIFLSEGELLLQGSPSEIVRDERWNRVFAFGTDTPFELLEVLSRESNFSDVYEYGKLIKVIGKKGQEVVPRVEQLAERCGIKIFSVEEDESTIEDVFVRLTRGGFNDAKKH